MVQFVKDRWAVLVAFVAGWAGETWVGFSDILNAVLVAAGVK